MPVETDADAATLGLAGSSLLDNVASPSPDGLVTVSDHFPRRSLAP
jgi:hypothetical protein